MRELSIMLCRRIASCRSSLIFGFKSADARLFSANIDESLPSVLARYPVDSRMSRFAVAAKNTIVRVFGVRSFPKVGSSVVERVMVSMVGDVSRFWVRYLVVHSHHPIRSGLGNPLVSSGVKRFCVLVPSGVPIPLDQPFEVGCIHDCDLSLSERDVSDRLILRLNNRLAVHAKFGHDPTSNRIAAVQPLFHFNRKVA